MLWIKVFFLLIEGLLIGSHFHRVARHLWLHVHFTSHSSYVWQLVRVLAQWRPDLIYKRGTDQIQISPQTIYSEISQIQRYFFKSNKANSNDRLLGKFLPIVLCTCPAWCPSLTVCPSSVILARPGLAEACTMVTPCQTSTGRLRWS